MKPQTEKPAEPVMRFFTPDLYIRFNSTNDEEADRADEAWETAIREYRHYLDSLRDRMPVQVRKLAELCLHDAELLAQEEVIDPLVPLPVEPFGPFPFWSAVAILSVRQDGTIFSLIYVLWDRVRECPPESSWPFSKLRTHWLYDEIDIAPNSPGMFLQRILFSDGRVIEIPFVSALIHTLPLPGSDKSQSSRQSA
jgi:hypothetical protein